MERLKEMGVEELILARHHGDGLATSAA